MTVPTFTTQDMSFAAFLVMNEFKISDVKRSSRRVTWTFEISEADLARMEAVWPSTSECRYFNCYQTLKNQVRK
jgi:hypothetical protein